MRVIAGELKGHIIKAHRRLRVRPTIERIRESLFDILGEEVVGKRVLDLFAGVGTLGIEALSRGAEFCVFVESSRCCLKTLRENLCRLKLTERSLVVSRPFPQALNYMKELGPFPLVIADPPYERGWAQRVIRSVGSCDLCPSEAVVVLQHHRKESLSLDAPKEKLLKERRIGDTILSFIRLVRQPTS